MAALTAGIVEEIRGYVTTRLCELAAFLSAVIATSVLGLVYGIIYLMRGRSLLP